VAVFIMSEPERKHGSPFDPAPLSAEDDGLGPRGSAPSQSVDEPDAIPALNVSDRAAAILAGSADLVLWQKAIGTSLRPVSRELSTTVALQMEEPPLRRGKSLNVVGLLEGRDARLKAETIIIDAHYDHLGTVGNGFYPGANDNASGTAAVIELARVFARGPRPRRSILFVVFGSEEEGLLGSYYYTEHPLRPLQTTRAVLNLDMIARDEEHIPQSRNVVNIPENTSNLINLVGGFYSPELVKQIRAADRSVDLDLSDKFDHDHDMNVLFRCYHFPFLLKDVPSVWIFAGFHPGYHRTVDTIEKLNFLKLEKVTRLTYLAARRLADSDHPPRFQATGAPKN
jgi:Zn-dependent M28 family amino/carboxypeptidase